MGHIEIYNSKNVLIDANTLFSMFYPSGKQIQLTYDNSRAVITEVGATLRIFEVGGEPVIWGFDENEICSAGRGQVLAPWPGRIQDGTYTFLGTQGVAGLDDLDRCCAIHGLVRWVPWKIQDLTSESVQLEYWLAPQPAYQFSLRLTVIYTLGNQGLTVNYHALNEGDKPLPFGIGFHPYLAVNNGSVDNARIQIPASIRLLLSDRGLPVGTESVATTSHDFRQDNTSLRVSHEMRALGNLRMSDCYSDLSFEEDGNWRVLFKPSTYSETTVEVWGDHNFKYVLVFTGDPLPEGIRRRAVAIEPMTCPPNAFRTGKDVIILQPGETNSGKWGISQLERTNLV